jgi:hypothetical protein
MTDLLSKHRFGVFELRPWTTQAAPNKNLASPTVSTFDGTGRQLEINLSDVNGGRGHLDWQLCAPRRSVRVGSPCFDS